MVAGLLLAAGAGRRFGRPKALLRLKNRPLIAILAERLAQGGCDPVIVVLGASADLAAAHIAAEPRLMVVHNEAWESGMGSSLIAGLSALPEQVTAVVVTLVDKPGITAAAVRRVAALAEPNALAAGSFHGERGHPVLFERSHWAGVSASATGDSGARDYLRAHPVTLVECGDVACDDDIDTPEAAAAWGIE